MAAERNGAAGRERRAHASTRWCRSRLWTRGCVSQAASGLLVISGKVNDGADEHQRRRDEDFISLENDFV